MLTDEADVTFVSEVLAGCVQFHQLIKAIVGGYYWEMGRLALELTPTCTQFLKFFLDNLKGWIRDEACKLYDRHFLETSILSPVLNYELELQEFLHELSDKLSGNDYTKPFSLTKPRPRSVPTPEKIPVLKASRPLNMAHAPPLRAYSLSHGVLTYPLSHGVLTYPLSHSVLTYPLSYGVLTYPSTGTQVHLHQAAEEDQLTRAREKNRRKAEDILREAERSKFSCATAEKSEKTKNRGVFNQIQKFKLGAQFWYSGMVQTWGYILLRKEKRPVKLNAAAILREGARVLKEEEEEERNSVAVEGQLSYEEAIIAKQKYLQGNREKVQSMKEEMDSLMDQYYSQLEEEQREMRALVEGVMEGHQSSKEAKQRIQETKHAIAQQMNKESQELLARAFEQAEADMRQKAELIQQIKAMESVPIIRAKFVDTTETGGQGLLAEMSLAELKERLSLMRIAEEEEEERKRKEILAAKQTKELMLSEALNMISLHRLEQSKQQAAKWIVNTEKALVKLCRRWDEVLHTRFAERSSSNRHLKEYVELNDTKLTALQQKLEDRRKGGVNDCSVFCARLSEDSLPVLQKPWRSLEKDCDLQPGRNWPPA
eukprot:Em0013g1104a